MSLNSKKIAKEVKIIRLPDSKLSNRRIPVSKKWEKKSNKSYISKGYNN